MADKNSKNSSNVEGKFYVDDQCIACDACVIEAPAFFKMNNDDEYAFVSIQPSSKHEILLCIEALEACPVDAIGNDGSKE